MGNGKAKCLECGKSFDDYHTSLRQFCSVGCEWSCAYVNNKTSASAPITRREKARIEQAVKTKMREHLVELSNTTATVSQSWVRKNVLGVWPDEEK